MKKGVALSKVSVAIVLLLAVFPFTLGFDVQGQLSGITFLRPGSQYIDDTFFPPEYLSVDDLFFRVCTEEPELDISATLLCEDDISFFDLDLERWLDDENCFIGSFDFSEKDCTNYRLEAQYTKDDEVFTFSEPIRVNRLSSMIDFTVQTQFSDGGWRDSVNTAAGIWVLSHFETIFDEEIELAIDWLKLNRNNEEKCWPKDDCSISTTAKILSYLTSADLNRTRRIVHDGEVFLQLRQNYFLSDDIWEIEIEPLVNGTTACVFSYNESGLVNITVNLSFGNVQEYEFTPVEDQIIDVVCDENFRADLYSQDRDTVFAYEGDNMTFSIPKTCWSKDPRWGECDLESTLFAMLTNISDSHRGRGNDFLDTEIIPDRAGFAYIGQDANVTLSALYLRIEQDSEIVSWLRFNQNNNGSWGNNGTSNDVIPTGHSILGLLNNEFNRTTETIADAEEWVSEREAEFANDPVTEYVGWNTTEKNALGFLVLKNNQRPLLKSRPRLIVVDKNELDVTITNPTAFAMSEVTYNLSPNLEDILGIEGRDAINSFAFTILKITKNISTTDNLFGYLSVNNLGDETARIPVLVVNTPILEMQQKVDRLTVFGTNTQVAFSVTKSAHSFNCDLTWEDSDLKSKTEYTLSGNELIVDITFNQAERSEKNYAGEFKCTAADEEFTFPFEISVSRYATFPFAWRPADIVINESGVDQYIIVRNKLDETLEVQLAFQKPDTSLSLSEEVIAIDPGDEYNVTLINRIGPLENITKKNNLELTALGEKKTVSVLINVENIEISTINPLVLWIIIIVIFTILGVGTFVAWKYKEKFKKMFKKGSSEDPIKMRIKKIEQREKNTAIMNMVKIMRFMNKDDATIRSRLKEEGFKEEEIDKAIEEGEKEAAEAAKKKEEDEKKEDK